MSDTDEPVRQPSQPADTSSDLDERPLPLTGRLAGIDYGTVRIGVAICDPGQVFSSPHENYNRRVERHDASYFVELVKQESIVGFVVGLPIHISGDESEKSREARAFGKWLQTITELPVNFYDERYTSAHAEEQLMAAKLTKKRRKARLDMLAAQLILKSFLDSRQQIAARAELDRTQREEAE